MDQPVYEPPLIRSLKAYLQIRSWWPWSSCRRFKHHLVNHALNQFNQSLTPIPQLWSELNQAHTQFCEALMNTHWWYRWWNPSGRLGRILEQQRPMTNLTYNL